MEAGTAAMEVGTAAMEVLMVDGVDGVAGDVHGDEV